MNGNDPYRVVNGTDPKTPEGQLPEPFSWHNGEHCNWRSFHSHECRMCRKRFGTLDQMINGWMVCEPCFNTTLPTTN